MRTDRATRRRSRTAAGPIRGAIAAALLGTALLGGCSSEDPPEDPVAGDPHAPSDASSPSATTEPSPEPTPEAEQGPLLRVTIAGDDVGPNAEVIELPVGEPLKIRITSDRAGELHVHSKPEQYVEFDAGTSTHELVVETPGSVEIEEHDTSTVVAQLRVTG